MLGRVLEAGRRSHSRTVLHDSKVTLCLQGRPFQAELEVLAVGGQQDPVVRAALAALPQQLADQVDLTPLPAHTAPSPCCRHRSPGAQRAAALCCGCRLSLCAVPA